MTDRLTASGRFEYRKRDPTLGDWARHHPYLATMLTLLFLVASVVLVASIVSTRSELSTAFENVAKCRANIVSGLQKRFDLVSGVLAIALHYEKYESSMLRQADDRSLKRAAKLTGTGARLVIADLGTRYPGLRANEPYQVLMGQLQSVENDVDQLFKAHNDAVALLNAKLATILGGIAAGTLGDLPRHEYLDSSMADKLLPREVDLKALRRLSDRRGGTEAAEDDDGSELDQ